MPVCLYISALPNFFKIFYNGGLHFEISFFPNGQPTVIFFLPDIRSQTRNSINILSILVHCHWFSSCLPVQMTFSTLKLVSKIWVRKRCTVPTNCPYHTQRNVCESLRKIDISRLQYTDHHSRGLLTFISFLCLEFFSSFEQLSRQSLVPVLYRWSLPHP